MRRAWTVAVTLMALAGLTLGTAGTALAGQTATYDGLIPGGWGSFSQARTCQAYDACTELEGVVYEDVNISEPMEAYDEWAQVKVTGTLASYTTFWFVCGYDGTDTLVECWKDQDRDWGMTFQPGEEIDTIRLFPVESAGNGFHVRLTVE